MRKPKTYSVSEVLDNTLISPVFSFYSSKDDRHIVSDLSQITNKKVILTLDSIQNSYTTSVLLKEYDSSKPLFKLSFGWLPYEEALKITEKVLIWITESAMVDYHSSMKVNLTFNERNLQTLDFISNMNVGKMILKIDEDYIWKRFPEMKTSPHAISIKKLAPTNNWLNVSDVLVNLNETFQMPIAPYYGVDFTNQTRGILTFNYIGGKNYPTKIKEVKELLEYYAIITFQTLNEEHYTSEQVEELRRISGEYRKLQKCYYNPQRFMDEYKDIIVTVNLERGPQIIKSFWTVLRDPLLKLVLEADLKKGRFNLDTDTGYYQIKNVKLDGVRVTDFEIVESEISGVIEHCHLWKAKINSSRVLNSTFISNNKINECHLTNSRIDRNNKVNKSYIMNNGEIVNCDVTESIIRNAGIGKNAKLDDVTTVIQPKDRSVRTPDENMGVSVEELRDYRWLRSLDGAKKDEGFANEYKED